MCKLCIYCEVIELPTCGTLNIHFSSLFNPIYIEFKNNATNSYIKYIPTDGLIDGGEGIKLSHNWIDLYNKNRITEITDEEIINLDYEEIV